MKINTGGFIKSTIVAIWYVAIVTIGAEIYSPLKDFFVKVGGHHWTGKSILTIGLFIVVYFVLSGMRDSNKLERGIWAVIINAVIGGIVIFGYFVWHFFAA